MKRSRVRTSRARAPRVRLFCMQAAGGTCPRGESRRAVGLTEETPQNDAGTRSEPARSDPIASSTIPAATAAAEPPELPPGVRWGSYGLLVRPWTLLKVCMSRQPAGTLVLPMISAPARRKRAMSGASAGAGSLPWRPGSPHTVGMPATSIESLTRMGRLASKGLPGPTSTPAAVLLLGGSMACTTAFRSPFTALILLRALATLVCSRRISSSPRS
jgi:hypothetical protein